MTLKYYGTPNPLCVGEIASDKYTPDPLSPNSKLGYFTWIELNPNSRACPYKQQVKLYVYLRLYCNHSICLFVLYMNEHEVKPLI